MTGLMPHQITSDQHCKLQKFRNNVSDLLQPEHDDHYLLRWLKARKFDLRKSEQMLRDHFEFRKRWDVDYLANDWTPPEVLNEYFVGGIFGEDREGSPVWFDPFGHIDTKGIYMSVTKRDFLKFKIVACERIEKALKEQSNKYGRRIDMYTLVFDMDKVNLSHFWRPFVSLYNEVIKIWEANYPERLKVVLIINAPRMFVLAFQNIIRPFLNEETMAKAVIADSHYYEALFKLISKDNVPVYYGGTAVDSNGDPKCLSKIGFGGKVPRSNYLSDQLDLDSMSQLHVANGTAVDLKFKVTHPGSMLKWDFKTEKCNICFGVYREIPTNHRQEHSKPRNHSSSDADSYTGQDWVEMIPLEKVICDLVPEGGGLKCQEAGTYILRFDNTYSWLRSKKVYYSVEVIRPDGELNECPT